MENDRIQVVWPECGEQPAFARDNLLLAEATRALHGTETPDPLWAWTNDQSLISVHPLGGCVMADDAAGGVVDHKGRVFDPVSGGVHDGLYVCDGSVIPCALDANPSLTISAIAERTAALLIEDRGVGAGQRRDAPEPRSGAGAGPRPAAVHRAPDRLRLDGRARRLHRRLRPGPRRQRPRGSAHHHRVRRHPGGAQRPAREARITGTVVAPALSTARLTVIEGRFRALRSRPGAGGDLAHAVPDDPPVTGGAAVLVRGPQGDPRGRGPARLVETTTLYTTISGPDGQAPGTGILYLKPADLPKLLRSIKVDGVPRRQQGEYRRAFLELFADEMVHVYGGVLDEVGAFPSAPRTAPAVREPPTRTGSGGATAASSGTPTTRLGDDAFLRLTRYRAGDKGPLIMATGFGMSSHSFLASTIEQNLTEFLADQGYDIWLFDYRAGHRPAVGRGPSSLSTTSRRWTGRSRSARSSR